jgi:hypothetical protein
VIDGKASTHRVLGEVFTECTTQDRAAAAAGLGPLPDGTGRPLDRHAATRAALLVDEDTAGGRLTHRAELLARVSAALPELDPVELRKALIEISAYAARWVLAIDDRLAGPRLAEGPEPTLFPAEPR